ncbi:hypothetical protein [Psychroserpens algicola]|uniref:Secreted protein n=1 Tax=Psychroserpens algicola TaxID=1719034 RepID=A0ABT0H960_9FLAO|nr:hypothetical protein [Psychroserpens algicola]MCK8480921.1 hypothetical protein [Psychroserpens algicola]
MSINNLKLLSFVLGYFSLSSVFTSSDINYSCIEQPIIKKAIYGAYLRKITTKDSVYICKGPSSKRYHYTKTCRGLSACSTKTYKVSLSEAKELKRTLCGWED